MLHEKNKRENLHVMEFHLQQIFPEFLQPLRDLRTQRVAPIYRGFLIFLEFYWLGVSSGRRDLSSTFSFDTCTGEMSLSFGSSRC